jgi:aminopeptidase YwaD
MVRSLALAAVAALLPGAGSADPGPGARAKATVALLAAEGPRPAGEPGAELFAQRHVAAVLRGLGYRVVLQGFSLPNGRATVNVVGLSTRGPPRVLLAAHLDGVRGSPAANDNASGVAVLLELARALRGRPGVWVVATGAEERAVTTSRVHLGSLRLLRAISPNARRTVGLAAVLDMVGVGTRLHVRGIERSPNRSARRLLRGGGTYLPDGGESDHAELSRGGLPTAWVQWREDRCWHEPCDRAARVDPRLLQAAYRLVLSAALEVFR